MTECVLHIGFGKTGTSALQTHLCRHPELGTPRGHHYVVVDRGAVAAGDQIRATSTSFPHYVASEPDLWGRADLEAVGRKLEAVGRRGVPVLSQEDWSRTGRRWVEKRALKRMGVSAHVVAYVRPQVEWFNSGWWQWWTWEKQFDTPADVLEKWRNGRFLWWRRRLDYWRAGCPGVSRLSVRLYRRNTIPDFLRLMGADGPVPAGDNMVNLSLAPQHIRILKSLPHLRGPHDSHIDSVLQQYLPSAESAPWALDPQIMQAIVDGCRKDNERLMELLSPEDAEGMRRDSRWWSIEPYRDRAVVPADKLRATSADLDRAMEGLRRMVTQGGAGPLVQAVLRAVSAKVKARSSGC